MCMETVHSAVSRLYKSLETCFSILKVANLYINNQITKDYNHDSKSDRNPAIWKSLHAMMCAETDLFTLTVANSKVMELEHARADGHNLSVEFHWPRQCWGPRQQHHMLGRLKGMQTFESGYDWKHTNHSKMKTMQAPIKKNFFFMQHETAVHCSEYNYHC